MEAPLKKKLPICCGRVHVSASLQHWNLHHLPENRQKNRSYTHKVVFEKRFAHIPRVSVFLSAYDVPTESDCRIAISADNIRCDGFDIIVGTWLDTLVVSCTVTYVAFDDELSEFKTSPIQSGRVHYTPRTHDWLLHMGMGDRRFSVQVPFALDKPHFSAAPRIFYGFSLLDSDQRLHAIIPPEQINSVGFRLDLSTWSDSLVWSADISWVAFSAVFVEKPPLIEGVPLRLLTNRAPFITDYPTKFIIDSGSGNRSRKTPVEFDESKAHRPQFARAPSVITALSHVHLFKGTDSLRVGCNTEKPTPEGFDAEISTWGTSKMLGAWVSWLALGEAKINAKSSAEVSNSKVSELEKKVEKLEVEEDSATCNICFDATINSVFIPCGHLATCKPCGDMLPAPKLCPICRKGIDQIIQTFQA